MTCLGKSNEKYITFSVPIESKVETFDKTGKEITKTISYRLQFVGSTRFMESSLSNLVNNLAEWIHEIRRKSEINVKCVIKCKDYDCFLKYTNFKDYLIEYKYVGTRFIKKKIKKNENLKKHRFNTCKFSNHDSNKLILFLRKGNPYRYMDAWEKFNEITLPENEDFYWHLNMEDICDDDMCMQKEFAKILK